jgi:hypothetical protein
MGGSWVHGWGKHGPRGQGETQKRERIVLNIIKIPDPSTCLGKEKS